MFGSLVSGAASSQNRPASSDPRIDFTPLAATGRAAQERIELQNITVSELAGDHTRALSSSLAAHAESRGGRINPSPATMPLRQTLRRELPRLFEYHLPPGTHPSDLHIRYELRSTRGELDVLDLPELQSSRIQVNLRPLLPVVLDSDSAGTTLQGGVTLELNIEDVHAAGRYQGSLTVLIDNL